MVGDAMANTTMNISLPDSMKAFVDEQMAADGYGTASEYVRDLIRADQRRSEEEKLEKLLLERLEFGAEREVDMNEVREELVKRLSKKK
jgi:antitoxin ParD1/3/4